MTDLTNKHQTEIDKLNLQQLNIRFYDIEAIIKSDSPAYLNIFASMYHRFRIDPNSDDDLTPVEFTVLTTPNNPWGKPVIIFEKQVSPLNHPGLLQGYIYESVLNQIIAKVSRHFLIHAGVVAHNGQGVIIAADSSHGKTTLTLELVRRGCRFLSDEMAAIGRTDQQVHPFPRSLRVRPGTLEMVGFSKAIEQADMWLDKLLLDIETIKPNSLGQTSNINHIIILKNPAEKSTPETASELGIIVERLDESLLNDIRQLEGVIKVDTGTERGYPLINLQAANRMTVLAQVEALCQARQILLLDLIKRKHEPPTFDNPAQLKPIPLSQATITLLNHFQGGHKSDLLQAEFGGSSRLLFIELMSLIGAAKCYELSVGPLPEMADLVSELVGLTN